MSLAHPGRLLMMILKVFPKFITIKRWFKSNNFHKPSYFLKKHMLILFIQNVREFSCKKSYSTESVLLTQLPVVISLRFQELHNFYELLTTSSKNGLNYHKTYYIWLTVYYIQYIKHQTIPENESIYVMITLDYNIQMGAMASHNT